MALIFFIFGHPLDKLAAKPEAFALDVVELVPHVANAILEPVAPESAVALGAELPKVSAFPVTFIVFELAFVLATAVEPSELTIALLFVVDPVALVLDPVGPSVDPVSAYLVVHEVTFVDASIGTSQLTETTFLASIEFTQVDRFVRVCFSTLTMRFVA